ncbi:hypothetical protein SCHPADRAFT_893027 [Schizopora paradoxa]|uniref:Uncharacterized protein n=1 Tax=Schizopora paradoxa TaxID=27342 RepID=A0A0H2RCF1_9AGAM|nr:hypothetical protein SCHPADRAFT_893027 [Schizopora paradoxa]
MSESLRWSSATGNVSLPFDFRSCAVPTVVARDNDDDAPRLFLPPPPSSSIVHVLGLDDGGGRRHAWFVSGTVEECIRADNLSQNFKMLLSPTKCISESALLSTPQIDDDSTCTHMGVGHEGRRGGSKFECITLYAYITLTRFRGTIRFILGTKCHPWLVKTIPKPPIDHPYLIHSRLAGGYALKERSDVRPIVRIGQAIQLSESTSKRKTSNPCLLPSYESVFTASRDGRNLKPFYAGPAHQIAIGCVNIDEAKLNLDRDSKDKKKILKQMDTFQATKTLLICDAKRLKEIYEAEDPAMYGQQFLLEFSLERTPVIAAWWEGEICNLDVAKPSQMQVKFGIRDFSKDQNVANSYGLRCLIEDMKARGYSALPSISSSPFLIVSYVLLLCEISREAVLVQVRCQALGGERYWDLFIRYPAHAIENVLNVLKCRPFGAAGERLWA